MLRKDGGVSDHEAISARERLRAATTLADIEALLTGTPLYQQPGVQASILDGLGSGSEHEQAICDRFFLLLHRKGHLALAGVRPSATLPTAPAHSAIPSPYRRLLEFIGDRLPPPHRDGPLSRSDTASLAEDLRAMGITSAPGDLDLGQPDGRAAWSLVSARCALCAHEQLVARVHFLDVRSDGALRSALDDNEGSSACRACGCDVLDALDVWIQDPPMTGDALGALATVVRVADWLELYQPPAWGLDAEHWGTVLEARSQRMAQLASGSPRFCSLTYSRDELRSQLALCDNDIFRLACAALEYRLERGFGSLADIEAYAQGLAASAVWPPVLLDTPIPRGRRFGAVAIAILAEALGYRPGHSAAKRALLSVQLATAWTAAGEYGPAQSAAARAKTALGELDAGALEHAELETIVAGAEADILAALGRDEQAAANQLAAMIVGADANGTLPQRIQHWRAVAKVALIEKQTGRSMAAIPAFAAATANLYSLRNEVSDDDEALHLLVAYALSGALANFAGALMDVADDVAAGGNPEPVVLEVALAIDESSSPGETEPTRLLRAAARLLDSALALSTKHEFWTFAARQAWRGAEVLCRAGSSAPPEWRRAYMQMALDYARRASDREMLIRSSLGLAADDAQLGRFDHALKHLELATRACGERRIDAGGVSWSAEDSRACTALALRLAHAGASPVRAVLVVESQKCVRIARSMDVGRLGHGSLANSAVLRQRYARLQAREADAALQVAASAPEDRGPWETEYRIAQRECAAVRRELLTLDPRFVRWSDTRTVALPEEDDLVRILSSLGPRTTLLGAFVDADHLWSYAVWPGGGAVRAHDKWPTWKVDVEAVVGQFASNVVPDQELLERVSNALLAPIGERLSVLAPSDRLVISQCAELAQVPFAALCVGSMRLVERLTISYTPGLAVLAATTSRDRRAPVRALALGAPYRFEHAPPHALAEVTLVGELCREAGIAVDERVGSQARPAELAALAPTADLVHIACHSRSSHSEAHAPCLELAPDGEDDGNLTAARIASEIDARPGSTFVLAACESAPFDAGADEATHGLVPALLVAGAAAVAAALWNINDRDALDFHQAFYRHLLAGCRASEALARTQREALHGALGVALSKSKSWPAFVLYGR